MDASDGGGTRVAERGLLCKPVCDGSGSPQGAQGHRVPDRSQEGFSASPTETAGRGGLLPRLTGSQGGG